MKLKLPYSVQNWISVVGAVIALVAFFMIVFLFTITTVIARDVTYLGLVTYILLPSVMIVGLILIPIGMIFTIRQRKKNEGGDVFSWVNINLQNVRHRNAALIFLVGTTIFLFMSAVGSYEAFHFTESVTFCGQLCHEVMNPEYVAYQNSAHARVRCVECHVGEGADWYVRSKISGMYQVYAVVANVYPRPIETPIKNLRPARETCERCHWPQKFYAQKLRLERHYLNDEENTQWDIRLTMKIGSDHAALGLREGIHWHINKNVQVDYIATDREREEIPWVRLINKQTGDTTIYMDEENPIDEETIAASEIRTMDCMDCHTRPSHNYRPPAFFVNEAITAGLIPRELPGIKSLAMDICAEDFSTTDSAMAYIEKTILETYESDYPEIYSENKELVEQAITGLQTVYGQNIFPEMKTRWSAYPNHIGHLEFNGCFRCHNDGHANDEGKVISRECNLCHEISAQGTPSEMEVALVGQALEFKHPVDIEEAWKDGLCTDCHTGLNP